MKTLILLTVMAFTTSLLQANATPQNSDNNGKETIKQSPNFKVYEHDLSRKLTIEMLNPPPGIYQVLIMNSKGNEISNDTFNTHSGFVPSTIRIGSLKNDTYTIIIKDGKQTYTYQLIKETHS
jgi:hypothetical protein